MEVTRILLVIRGKILMSDQCWLEDSWRLKTKNTTNYSVTYIRTALSDPFCLCALFSATQCVLYRRGVIRWISFVKINRTSIRYLIMLDTRYVKGFMMPKEDRNVNKCRVKNWWSAIILYDSRNKTVVSVLDRFTASRTGSSVIRSIPQDNQSSLLMQTTVFLYLSLLHKLHRY